MATAIAAPKKALISLEDCIASAMKKVNANKEAHLCRFIPDKDGHIHHFTFRKIKEKNPAELQKLIYRHVIDTDHPQKLPARARTKRASKSKKQINISFSRAQFGRLLEILKKSEDKELIDHVSPFQSSAQIQKLLMQAIKRKEVDFDLWEAYTKLVKQEAASEQEAQ